MKDLFEKQLSQLKEAHFLALYWTAKAEEKNMKYNITNIFDDLKYVGATRTKQSAVAFVDALAALCFIEVTGEGNRKHLYISSFGAKALESLLSDSKFKIKKSMFLEGGK
jgi:hypothetical protein